MKDLAYRTLEETDLKSNICSYQKIGGYSANNFCITTDEHVNLFLKEFIEQDIDKAEFIDKISNILTTNKNILYWPPIISKSTYQIFPWIEGNVFHGKEIKKSFYKYIIFQLSEFEKLSPKNIKLGKSIDVYNNIDKAEKSLNEMLDVIEKEQNGSSPFCLLESLIKTKIEIVKKIRRNKQLYNWLLTSNDFVHGDFHNENLLFHQGKLIAVLDFELAHIGNRLEDVINFIWFAFLNTSFSRNSISRAHTFLRAYNKERPFSRTDLENALNFFILKLSQSTFIEKSFYQTKDTFLFDLVKRDEKKFKHINRHFNDLIKKLSDYNE